MNTSMLAVVAIAASAVFAAPTQVPVSYTAAIAKVCTAYTIPLTVTSQNLIWAAPKFKDNYDVTDLTTEATARLAKSSFHPFADLPQNQTATYTLSGTFCTPSKPNTPKQKTVLLATHGLNFNRGYWDPEIEPERYSLVDYAIKEGYSIFFYDRLGVGKSQKVSGYLNQFPIQAALARELARAIKEGKYTGTVGKPEKLVLVGHSYGSAISAGVLSVEPGLADGLIMTGFSYAGANIPNFISASQLKIASTQDEKWKGLDNGYLTAPDIYSNINSFFKKPDYTLPVAHYAEANKEPIAIAEVLTAGLGPVTPFEFKGAAMVIAGKYDFIFCGSDCDDVIAHPATEVFSKAKVFRAVSYPGAGHGLNFAQNAPGAFKIIFDFIAKNV